MDKQDEQPTVSNPLEHVVMCSFTGAELKMLLNSVHERANRLLNKVSEISRSGYIRYDGYTPTIEDIRALQKGSDTHFNLQKKVQKYMNT